MRKLFGNNNATLFDLISEPMKMTDEEVGSKPKFEGIAYHEIDHLVHQLRESGYCLLSERLNELDCLELEQIARTASCELIDPRTELKTAIFDEKTPVAVRYEIPEEQIVQSNVAQRLICDQSVYEVAKQYLECEPVQDLVTMWWSTSINTEASSVAAQQFHFDLDRIRFLKLFVYLTDVDENNGPHVYVPNSHKNLPGVLRRDGRHSDESVKRYYPEHAIITGSRGLVFLADTRGLHKGLPLVSGHRLIFQTEYANSLFGYPYKSVKLTNVAPITGKTVQTHPKFLTRFIID
jgi:ectoine hydroxylase-related dioxygenase (phytanoyl-CoA dioxygenase family)